MSLGKWADYSGGRPSGAALHNAGFVGVIRYVGIGGSAKRLTKGEYANLVANGVQVKLVCELGIHDAEAGYAAGVANAKAARQDATSLGVPPNVTIYAAADEHMTASQVSAAVQYVKGFRDVLGVAQTGAYGFAEFVDAVHSAGYASEFWKSGSKPTASETFVTFWQRNAGTTTQSVDGVVVDIDDQLLALNQEDDLPLSADDVAAVAKAVWGYQNAASGDAADMHGTLTALPTAAQVWAYKSANPAAPDALDMHAVLTSVPAKVDAVATAVAKVPTTPPVATVDAAALASVMQAAVETAVAAGLSGLQLAVSDSAVAAIAAASGKAAVATLKSSINSA